MSIQYKQKTIQYIASDLDGTLLHKEGHTLDKETYDLISKCIKKGITFIVASGRTYENEKMVMEPIKNKISYIAGSGTVAMHNEERIAYHLIEKEDAHKILTIANSIPNCLIFVCTNTGAYTNSNYPPFFEHLKRDVGIQIHYLEDIYSICDEPIEKISAFFEKGSHLITPIFQETLPNFNVVTSGPQWIDFLFQDVNKGTTLQALLHHLQIHPENGIAFGDQENDIEMLQTAGIGYCMSTGVKKAKEAADFIIQDPKDILKEILMDK